MKRDIHHHEQTYKNWKERVLEEGFDGLNKKNSDILLKFVFDMENGENIARGSKKGPRSFGRLNVLRQKVRRMIELLEERDVKDITKVKESKLHTLVNDMYKGKIVRKDNGQPISYVNDYVSNFKAFWHWWMKVNRKKGITLEDITEDLSTEIPKSRFVYVTKSQMEEMLPYFNEQQQVLIMFLFDSLIRFPTEALSLTVKDVYEKNGEVWINIDDAISKTYGRTFNLLYCGEALQKYIRKNNLQSDDRLFSVNYLRFTQKLKKIALQVFGDKVSHPKAGKKYAELTGYDFRHSGAIHLRQLAQKTNISLDALRQRGGWTGFDMLNYYTAFIGLTGEIRKEDLLVAEDKSNLEKRIDRQDKIIAKLNKKLFDRDGFVIEEK